jgi:hypothetical protein
LPGFRTSACSFFAACGSTMGKFAIHNYVPAANLTVNAKRILETTTLVPVLVFPISPGEGLYCATKLHLVLLVGFSHLMHPHMRALTRREDEMLDSIRASSSPSRTRNWRRCWTTPLWIKVSINKHLLWMVSGISQGLIRRSLWQRFSPFRMV